MAPRSTPVRYLRFVALWTAPFVVGGVALALMAASSPSWPEPLSFWLPAVLLLLAPLMLLGVTFFALVGSIQQLRRSLAVLRGQPPPATAAQSRAGALAEAANPRQFTPRLPDGLAEDATVALAARLRSASASFPTPRPAVVTVRARTRRHRRPMAVIGVVTVALLCCSGALIDTGSHDPAWTGYHTAVLTLNLLPLAVMGGVTLLNIRNVAVRLYRDGRLESMDWTGRRHVLTRPATVWVHALVTRSSMDHLLVITAAGGDNPIVLLPRWFNVADLAGIIQALRIPVKPMPATTAFTVRKLYAGHRFPWSLRHPVSFPIVVLLTVFGYFGLLLALTRMA